MKRPLIGIIPLIDIERESYWMLPGYMKGIEEAGGDRRGRALQGLCDRPHLLGVRNQWTELHKDDAGAGEDAQGADGGG